VVCDRSDIVRCHSRTDQGQGQTRGCCRITSMVSTTSGRDIFRFDYEGARNVVQGGSRILIRAVSEQDRPRPDKDSRSKVL